MCVCVLCLSGVFQGLLLDEAEVKTLGESFAAIDTDGSGKIAVGELVAMFKTIGENVSPAGVTDMIVRVGMDPSDGLDFASFCKV